MGQDRKMEDETLQQMASVNSCIGAIMIIERHTLNTSSQPLTMEQMQDIITLLLKHHRLEVEAIKTIWEDNSTDTRYILQPKKDH